MPLFALLSVLLAAGPQNPSFDPPDSSQPQKFLSYLESCAAGTPSTRLLDDVMKSRGTQLVIAQQNVSRKVTVPEYRATLEAACKHSAPEFRDVAQDARSRKGVEGLTKDVLPSVLWGIEHRTLLQRRLTEYQRAFSRRRVLRTVRSNIPGGAPASAHFFFVMGGRAGAAVIENELYLDVLITESRAAAGQGSPLSFQEINAFFAHEAHHLAYDRLLEAQRQRLHFENGEEQAWNLLTDVMTEGSATYLVNGNSNLKKLQSQVELKDDFTHIDELLPDFQRLLQDILSNRVPGEAVEARKAEFAGNRFHVIGAVLLDQVNKYSGKQGIFACMEDPRTLLQAYNRAAPKSAGSFHFDLDLARRVTAIGDRHSVVQPALQD